MPILTHNAGMIETPNNSNDPVATGTVDLALLLSEYYGKNIRQGQNFTLTGVQAVLKPRDTGADEDFDLGGSVAVKLDYLPTTAHSRRAWNQAFTSWTRQKKLSNLRGLHPVRNEDFEAAWHADHVTSRTSKMNYSMVDNSSSEDFVLTGETHHGDDWSLPDFYNTTNPAPQRTANHYDGTLYKDNKYGGTKFPEVQSIWTTADASAMVNYYGVNALYGSASMDAPWDTLPSPAQVLCGLFEFKAWLIAEDTSMQIEDNMDLFLSFAIKKWKPLVFRPKRKSKKSKFSRRKASGRRFSRRRKGRR